MSKNCANKYAIIEAKTAIGDKEKTALKVSLSIGELAIAGTASAKRIIPMAKKEAKIPATTTLLAFFWP